MKKVIFVLFSASVIFASCKKECTAKIKHNENSPQYIEVNGKEKTIYINQYLNVARYSTVKVQGGTTYTLKDCSVYTYKIDPQTGKGSLSLFD